jgi:hypothetical protein
MLLGYAEAKNLKDGFDCSSDDSKLSSYWLYFITSTSYKLACALVSSMRVEVVCKETRINLLDVQPMSYQQALSRALIKVNEDKVASSWKDSLISGRFTGSISEYLTVPKIASSTGEKAIIDREYTINKIWSLEVTLDGIMVTGFGN